MDRVFFIIPAYNEQENIEKMVTDWYPIVSIIEDGHLVVINDGSKDNTYVMLQRLAENKPRLIVLSKENGGHGDTLLFGYRYAIECGADWIFQTDSDGQTKAEEFLGFWELRDKYDAIFGYRKKRGDGAKRKFVEDVLCFVLRIIFGLKIPDANCPFRLMRAHNVAKYIRRLPEHYFLPNVMLTVFFVKYDRVRFKEVTFENRKAGSGSINIKKIIKIGMKSIADFWNFKKSMT